MFFLRDTAAEVTPRGSSAKARVPLRALVFLAASLKRSERVTSKKPNHSLLESDRIPEQPTFRDRAGIQLLSHHRLDGIPP